MNKQDLENLKQDIAIAQKQLNEIVAATNREIIIQEQLVGDISKLKNDKISAENNANSANALCKKSEEQLSIVVQDLGKAKLEMARIKEAAYKELEATKEASIAEKEKSEKYIKDRKKELANIEELARTNLVSIHNDIANESKTLSILKNDIITLKQKKNEYTIIIQNLTEKITDCDSIIAGKEDRLRNLDETIKQQNTLHQKTIDLILEKQNDEAKYKKEQASIVEEIAELKKERDYLLESIEQLNTKNVELVGKAALIQEREVACIQREEYLKEKYTNAGIQYI